jgi:hypothetical protein
MFDGGLDWNVALLPLIVISCVLVLFGSCYVLSERSSLKNGKKQDFTVIFSAFSILVELTIDILTTGSLADDATLRGEYIAMIAILTIPVMVKFAVIISFLRKEGNNNPAFKDWMGTHGKSAFASGAYLLMLLKLDAHSVLVSNMLGWDCFNAPLGLKAQMYLSTMGSLDVVMENIPQAVISLIIAAKVKAASARGSLLFCQFALSVFSVLFNIAKRIGPTLYILVSYDSQERGSNNEERAVEMEMQANPVHGRDVTNKKTNRSADAESAIRLELERDDLTCSGWLSMIGLNQFEEKLMSDDVGISNDSWRSDIKELDVDACKQVGMSVVQVKGWPVCTAMLYELGHCH